MSNVIWVDEKDNILGEVTREKAHQDGLLHRISVIYLINEKGEILVNLRAKDAHLDHSSAGHVDVGESYLEAAKRELSEELGVSGVDLLEIGSAAAIDIYNNFKSNHIMKIFVSRAKPVNINHEEVTNVFWQNPNETLKDMVLNTNKYAGGFKSSIKVILDYLNKSNK
ncbi:NUDIX domain-containing protein [Candidatus Giovannonibacteria bacterium]|nr:NUDIX domain-containing protein [Candidatus Giovannonibacteria bacterium]